MDFLEFFNLNEDPFRLTPDPFYFFPSKEHNEVLSSLNYVLEQKEGFFLATGEPGTGKTTILKAFINAWKDRAIIALIMTPRLSPEEFLFAVLEDLNVKVQSTNKNDVIRAFRDFLVENAMLGKRIIIVVDEAQDMPPETLEELRLLSNFETEKEKLLQIVLIGQPQLRKMLASRNLSQLNQRITVRCTLKPLTISETSDYINYRLIKGGKGVASFNKDSVKEIYRFSKGIPRLINLISSRAMMAAYLEGRKTISKRHVVNAVSHILDSEVRSNRGKELLKRYIALTISLFSALAVAIWILSAGYLVLNKAGIENPASSIKHPVLSEEERHNSQVAGEGRTAKIIVDIANIMAQPGWDAEVVSWVSKDLIFDIIDEHEDADKKRWYKIRLSDGREGWILETMIKLNAG